MDILEILYKKKKSLNKLQDTRRNGLSGKEIECPGCKRRFSSQLLKEKMRICPDCGHYFAMTPRERIRLIADEQSFQILNAQMATTDPLAFPGYQEKLEQLREKTRQEDAVMTGVLKIGGYKTAVGVMDARFMMGSMGTVVGEQITAIAEYAQKKSLPLIIFCVSGGARMQEGIFSLMQMAKTSAAIERLKNAGGLYISVLCNPTTGGVSASFAFLGDIILAEPGALIGFAGPRVIGQTIGQKLPDGFQSAESQMENGMIDCIVKRRELRTFLETILRLHSPGGRTE